MIYLSDFTHSKKILVPFSCIVDAVIKVTGVQKDELLGHSRERNLPFSRHLIYYFGTKFSGKSLVFISCYLNHKDHTTGISGIKRIQGFIDTEDKETVDTIREINNLLNKKIV